MWQHEGKNEGLTKDVIQMFSRRKIQEDNSQICLLIEATKLLQSTSIRGNWNISLCFIEPYSQLKSA